MNLLIDSEYFGTFSERSMIWFHAEMYSKNHRVLKVKFKAMCTKLGLWRNIKVRVLFAKDNRDLYRAHTIDSLH